MSIAFALLARYWQYVVMAVLLAVIGGQRLALKFEHGRLESLRSDYDHFKLGVKDQADIQVAKNNITIAEHKASKEKADAESTKTHATLTSLADAYRKLRDSRASGGLVPRTGAIAGSIGGDSIDRRALNRALSTLDREVSELVIEGDGAIADLNTAKTWAQGVK